MSLTKPNQELRRDLLGLASDLKWSAVELAQIAGRLSAAGNEPDAEAVRRMCNILRTEELRLNGLVEEIQEGAIVRLRSADGTHETDQS